MVTTTVAEQQVKLSRGILPKQNSGVRIKLGILTEKGDSAA
ncbi:hypothetical protein [Nostoc sp.]